MALPKDFSLGKCRGAVTNSQLPIFVDENGFQYPASSPNQLQLYGSCEYLFYSVIIPVFFSLFNLLNVLLLNFYLLMKMLLAGKL